jgi:hypothetical protein
LLGELDALAAGGLATDVAWLRAVIALSDRNSEATQESLLAAIARSRTDPWCRPQLMKTALRNAHDVLTPAGAKVVATALLEGPFAGYQLEPDREVVLMKLASMSRDHDLVARVHEGFEPYPYWDEEQLEQRAEAYRNARPHLADRAQRDLERYRSHKLNSLSDLFEGK